MAQGYDKTKPAFQSGLSSEEMRIQLNALASLNAGDNAPIDVQRGFLWLDTSVGTDWKIKMFNDVIVDFETLFVNLNGATGIPKAAGVQISHTHEEAVATNPWNIAHNLNKVTPHILVTDGGSPENKIADSNYQVTYTDANNLVINFPGGNTSGKAHLQ